MVKRIIATPTFGICNQLRKIKIPFKIGPKIHFAMGPKIFPLYWVNNKNSNSYPPKTEENIKAQGHNHPLIKDYILKYAMLP